MTPHHCPPRRCSQSHCLPCLIRVIQYTSSLIGRSAKWCVRRVLALGNRCQRPPAGGHSSAHRRGEGTRPGPRCCATARTAVTHTTRDTLHQTSPWAAFPVQLPAVIPRPHHVLTVSPRRQPSRAVGRRGGGLGLQLFLTRRGQGPASRGGGRGGRDGLGVWRGYGGRGSSCRLWRACRPGRCPRRGGPRGRGGLSLG